MSGAPPAKRAKFYKNVAKNFLEVGCRGFLATTNFREKECVRECYNILNNYADELYGSEQLDFDDTTETGETTSVPKTDANDVLEKQQADVKKAKNDDDDTEEEEDIATTLAKEVHAAQAANAKSNKRRRFNHVATGASNCIFIKTSLRDPVRLVEHIVRDVAKTRQNITRNVLRFVPVEAVCKANVLDIKNAAGPLFDKYFLKGPPTTYSVVYNRRCNNDLNRDEIIRELAKLVDSKNGEHKVDLKSAAVSILVEIVKGLCCLSVVPDYTQLKKYNLAELPHIGTKPPAEVEGTVKVENSADKPVLIPDLKKDENTVDKENKSK